MSETAITPDVETSDRPFADGFDARPNLIGMDRDDIAAALVEMGEAEKKVRMRAQQLFHWVYHRGATDFDQMTTISKAWRKDLGNHLRLERPGISVNLKSTDNTRKWLLKFQDGHEAEAVHIPETDRGTLCISSQIGCTLTCSFCHTGTMKLVRNLTPGEIVSQMLIARDTLGEWPSPANASRLISNIVMMGMGEPLYNYEKVRKALTIIMDSEGIQLSRRRITLSTSGVVPMMQKCGEELDINLAISLHAVRDDLRDTLVPINKKYPLKELLQACRTYPNASNSRRITFEYVMLDGVNDSPADARELVRMIRGIPAKINLIPFNPWPGAPYDRSKTRAIIKFSEIVNDAGYASPVREPRGEDIMAACGQLKSDSVRQRGEKVAL